MPQVRSFKITPAMYDDAAMEALSALAEKRITLTRFFQVLDLALAGKEAHDEMAWLDLVDIVIDRGVAGFEGIQAALLEHNPSATFRQSSSSSSDGPASHPPAQQAHPKSLRQDPSAWRTVWDWAAGVFEFPELLNRLKSTFGASFVEAEWASTFNAVFDASSPDKDELSLSASGPPISAAVRAVEDAMETVGVSVSASRMLVPLHSGNVSSRRAPPPKPRRPTKRRKTASSIFLDISAAEGDGDEEEEEEEDQDEDECVGRSNLAAQVLPAGHAHYSQQLQSLIARYEEPQSPTTPCLAGPLQPHHLALPTSQEGRLYIVDFLTRNIANFCRTIFENRGLRCHVMAFITNKVYVEATSPLQIRNACPPSHTSTIRSILRVPDEDRPAINALQPSIRRKTWARVMCGVYRNDIAYVLSSEGNTCDVLLVPRRRPYDKIDKDDIQEIQEEMGRRLGLFDETEARNAGCRIETIDRDAGVLRCTGEEYHCGLLKRTYSKNSLQIVEVPHPDRLLLHAEAQVDPGLVERTYFAFSASFWKAGDLVRPKDGPLIGQRVSIISIDLDQGEVTVQPCDLDLPVCTLPVASVRRIFKQGDPVKVLAGVYRGSIGTILAPSEDQPSLLLEDTDVIVVPATFLETHFPSQVWTLTSRHSGLELNKSHSQEPVFNGIMQGDRVAVKCGTYNGWTGFLDSIQGDGWIWVMAIPTGGKEYTSVILHQDELKITPPENTLSFSKEKGYNVTVGDTLQVVRGDNFGVIGVVRSVDFPKAEVELIIETNGHPLRVSILLCIRAGDCSQFTDHRPLIGRDVWTIGGEKRGIRATLRAVNRSWCYVSFFGENSLKLRTYHVATEDGVRLDGTPLQGEQLKQLKHLVARSTEATRTRTPLPRARTPLPSRSPSTEMPDDDPSSAWKVTPDDLREPSPAIIDNGDIDWLFDDQFCNFSRYRFCFNISAGYRGGNYTKRVMCTTPDRFSNIEGPAPPGHVSLTVSGNHAGASTEFHNIPARFLSPASPTGKDQVVLVLRGDWRGRFCKVIRWVRKEKKALVTLIEVVSPSPKESMVLVAVDMCLAVPV